MSRSSDHTNQQRDERQLKVLERRVQDLESDLDNVIEIAYLRGATEWVRLHFPAHYDRLYKAYDSFAA